ncbi:MAG: protein translocase subunit SecD, partial [Acidimicrobiales bacterium]|nr:protein translocase subunit SecD [Acidimicrobiales bacterium]
LLSQAVSIIRNRVDAFGVAEPNISTQGGDIVVQLPGVRDRARALSLIGETAQLLFRPVQCTAPAFSGPRGSSPPTTLPQCSSTQTTPSTASGQTENVPPQDSALAKVPSTSPLHDNAADRVLIPVKGGGGRLMLGPAELTGASIRSATAAVTTTGQWQVNFNLTGAGSPKFDQLGAKNLHNQVAIDLDGVVQSSPYMQSSNFGGKGQITGNFTQSQAQNLALVLNYGALPVQLNQQSVQSVSPTLGAASLRAGLLAGIAGLVLVMIYTIFYYRALGIVVVAGLAVTAALLWAIVSFIGHTSGLALDLSGIVGLIVSIGVTVDSYVVYFERLKDEVRAGKTIRSSVDKGFVAAFRTIVAADAVSFLGALVLYLFSIAQVRGFAFFLGLSTLLDVVTAWVFTRPLVILLGRSRVVTEAKWIGMARGLVSPAEEAAV